MVGDLQNALDTRFAAAQALVDLGTDAELPACLFVIDEAPSAAMRQDSVELRRAIESLRPPDGMQGGK